MNVTKAARIFFITIFACLAFFLGGYVEFFRIYHYIDINNIAMANTNDKKQSIFNHEYPSSNDVYSYLEGSTIVLHSLAGNNYANFVYYFSRDGSVFEWNSVGFQRVVGRGTWSVQVYRKFLALNGHYKITSSPLVCVFVPSPETPAGHCLEVYNHDQIFPFDTEKNGERRDGDIFHLSQTSVAPFAMPIRQPISADGIVEEIGKSSNK
jgi:hypothetical protein